MTNKKQLCLALVGTALIAYPMARPVVAIPSFQKQFWAVYLDDAKSKAFVTLVKKKVKCNVCHDSTRRDERGKKSKKFRNAYGQELSKLLDKKQDKKNIEKIRRALAQVDKMKSNPKDPKSLTYGQRIRQEKLPVEPAKQTGGKTQ